MKPSNRRSLLALSALIISGAAISPAAWAQANAQDYPNRPIHLIQQFSPGGGSDAVARPLGMKLQKILGQPIVIDSKPGANGAIANQYTATAAPDGYTLLFAAAGPMTAAPHLYDLRVDPMAAFVPIALAVSTPYAIIVHRSAKVQTLSELLAMAKKDPGRITYGTSGAGGAPHLAVKMLSAATGIEFLHVAYKGMGPAMTAVLSKEVDFAFADTAYVIPQMKSETIKVLAVTGNKRSAALPDIPTVAELGISNYQSGTWYGFFAPKGTPDAIVQKLNKAVNEALADKALRGRFLEQGMDPASNMGQEQYASFVKSDYQKMGGLIKKANIKISE